MKQILIVDSVEDDITRRRHSILENSPRIKGYTINYVYAIELEEKDQFLGPIEILDNIEFKEESLYNSLKKRIELLVPDYVLLHTGFIFRAYPNIFYSVFKKLKLDFPNTGFGFQERWEMVVDKSAFSDTADVRSLQNLFFKQILGI